LAQVAQNRCITSGREIADDHDVVASDDRYSAEWWRHLRDELDAQRR
jgi:hypothetical protein